MKNTKEHVKQLVVVTTVLATGLASLTALADEGIVRAKVGYGLASYASGDISATYPTLGFGITYIASPSHIFADFSTRTTGSGATYNPSAMTHGIVTSDQPFSRTETTLTVGMPLENGLQGTAGIFTANTESKLAQFGQFSQKMTGLTAGVGMGFSINEGRGGAIGFNGAAALLNASNCDQYGKISNSNLSYGLSVGAAYNYSLTRNIGISADVKMQSYFIKYAAFSGDERILSLALSLIGQF